ncbi:MAG: ankyrin repeat domain-containing protein [Candidatus Midichloria sp.]|nr:ankyrin repeat domain-containing protein [Candidatus Midichloria sp.]
MRVKRNRSFIAADNGSDEIVKLLLQYPADPNIPNNDNAYPIHLAAKKNHPVAIAYLMENGAPLLQNLRYEWKSDKLC